MKLSLNWLQDYIDIKISAKDLAEKLTLSGTAVESIDNIKDQYKNIIVAEIKEVKLHPNADRLQIAVVFDGKKERIIVCGATNIEAGQKVPLALPGATLQAKLEIKKTEIRGVVSEGMLCSEEELGLGNNKDGILILDSKAGVGKEIVEELGLDDIILDLDLTPNRSDCYSVRGVAREVAALLNSKITCPPIGWSLKADGRRENHLPANRLEPQGGWQAGKSKLQLKTQNNSKELKIKIDDFNLCPKYCALVVKNITVGASPDWLQTRLRAVGIRPINNVVDVTNYVMMGLGQPMHAFDKSKITCPPMGKSKIILEVRKAKKGEKIITLDNHKRELDDKMLVITDGKKPIALAGVMGGAVSEVSNNTKEIVLEAAIFNPTSVRYSYRALGLRTEAAIRFEKGVDPQSPEQALTLAGKLLQKVASGKISGGIITQVKESPKQVEFLVDIKYINTLLGREFTFAEINQLLKSIGIGAAKIGKSKTEFSVTIPSWRHDLKIPADIAEEVGRLFDYNKLIPTPIIANITPPAKNKLYEFKKQIKILLKEAGYNEVYTYSFYGESEKEILGNSTHLELVNPVSPEQKFLRYSLVPLILRKASLNLRFFSNLKIFEIGTVFKAPELGKDLPKEELFLCGCVSIKDKDRRSLYSYVKGDIGFLLKRFGIQAISFSREENYIDITIDNTWLGQIRILDGLLAMKYKIRQDLIIFQFDINRLINFYNTQKRYVPIPEYPSIEHDLSFIVPEGVKYRDVEQLIADKSGYVYNIDLIDEYFKDSEYSITVRITYLSLDSTLENKEVEKIEKEIIGELERILGLQLRNKN